MPTAAQTIFQLFKKRPASAQGTMTVAGATSQDLMLARVAEVVKTDLRPLVRAIDEDHVYPADVLRALGAAGAYKPHVGSVTGQPPDLAAAIRAMASAGEECLSTAFCIWCQSTFAWCAENTENAALRSRYAGAAASAIQLGGTGLSNPMKSLFEIETFKLKGVRTEGGYLVRGVLPWVSNLGPDHVFGTMFEVDEPTPRRVMAMVPCDHPA
jgi:alkylation response protein AidB-like acyl-CoA dehydrogenase